MSQNWKYKDQPDIRPIRVHPGPVYGGVQAHAGVEALLECGAGDPHPVAGAHRPVCIYLVVEEELQSMFPVQPEISSGRILLERIFT